MLIFINYAINNLIISMIKLQEGSNGQKLITIPRDLVRGMGWDKGEELEFKIKDSKSLVLKSSGEIK